MFKENIFLFGCNGDNAKYCEKGKLFAVKRHEMVKVQNEDGVNLKEKYNQQKTR